MTTSGRNARSSAPGPRSLGARTFSDSTRRGATATDQRGALIISRKPIASLVGQWHGEQVLSENSVIAFVPSTDLDRSRRFYETVLGLPVVSEDGFAVVVTTRNATLRITNVGHNLTAQPFTVLGWEVDDLDQEVDQLVERGVQFLKVPNLPQDERAVWTAPDGTRVAWFKDPDGNTLSLDHHPT